MDIERRDWEFGSEDDGLVVESRADGRSVIRGYAVVYNRLSVDLGGFRERILPGAFDGVFSRQRGRADLVSYYNHNPDILLGRESSGTLKVWTDEKGVGFEVVPPASRADILELVARRDVKGASFTFSIDKNGEAFTTDENGRAIREVRAATIYELGPVVQPAYPSTSVSVAMRSYQRWLEEVEQRCACQTIAKPKADELVAKALAARDRLRVARLKTFIFGRGFCPTGPGGGIDNSCGKGDGGGGGSEGGGGSGGSSSGGDNGSSGSGSGDSGSAGNGSGPGGLQSPKGNHNVKLPASKSKLTIDQADEALKQMGYKPGPSVTKKVGKGYVTMKTVTDATGHTTTITTDEVKDLVYGNQK